MILFIILLIMNYKKFITLNYLFIYLSIYLFIYLLYTYKNNYLIIDILDLSITYI